MIRSGAIAMLGTLLLASAALGQDAVEAKDAIGLRVRVVEGLGAPLGTAGVQEIARLVPGSLEPGAPTGSFELTELDDLLAGLQGTMPQQPGVVTSIVVLGPKGVVVRGGPAGAGLPEWLLGPAIAGDAATDAALRAFGDVLRRDDGEYYLYVSVSACSV